MTIPLWRGNKGEERGRREGECLGIKDIEIGKEAKMGIGILIAIIAVFAVIAYFLIRGWNILTNRR